jgi:hypothetical protein
VTTPVSEHPSPTLLEVGLQDEWGEIVEPKVAQLVPAHADRGRVVFAGVHDARSSSSIAMGSIDLHGEEPITHGTATSACGAGTALPTRPPMCSVTAPATRRGAQIDCEPGVRPSPLPAGTAQTGRMLRRGGSSEMTERSTSAIIWRAS